MKKSFNIVFKDKYGDFKMTLHTSVPKTNEAIKNLIDVYAEICGRDEEDYSPVDIMDRLVYGESNFDGDWWWEDMDYDCIEIEGWKS